MEAQPVNLTVWPNDERLLGIETLIEDDATLRAQSSVLEQQLVDAFDGLNHRIGLNPEIETREPVGIDFEALGLLVEAEGAEAVLNGLNVALEDHP